MIPTDSIRDSRSAAASASGGPRRSGASAAPAEEQVRAGMLAMSRERIIAEGPVAELFHVIVAATVSVLVLGTVPRAVLAAWAVTLIAAVAARAVQRHRLARQSFDQSLRRAFAVSITALALVWGVGAGVFERFMPFEDVALMLVVVSGLVAGATSTLASDTPLFRAFLFSSLAPLAIGIVTGPLDRPRLVALVLVALFAASMLVLHQRAHGTLLEQVRTNLRLAASEQRAARERAHLDALFQSAPVATVVVDDAGCILDANPRFETLFGYSAAEARGRTLNDLIVHTTELEGAARMDAVVRGGETVVAEVERRRKDGRLVQVRVSAARVEGAGEEELFVLYDDIGEEVRARAVLREARDAAERVAQMRSSFLANMSHEIRTPLNAILGLAELMLDGDLTGEQRRSLGLIESSGESLLALLNDILDLSKIEAEGLQLETISFDLPKLVDSTVSLLAVRAREKRLELLADVGASVPMRVRGDPTRLRQVLINLVGNAIKFTGEGEVLVSVRRMAMEDGTARVRFAVRDTGIGIPEDKQTAIFEPFDQADLSMTRKYGGTGLGLTIAGRLVGMMGGALQVESVVGRGSEFSFAVDFPVEAAMPAPLLSPGAVRLSGLRMLIVDDNASNRRIVREMLAAVGVSVDDASGADEGLGILHRAARTGAPYPLVILDAQMPMRDGFQLAQDVRADPALRTTRLLMLTSAAQRGDAQRCRELGIRGYLTKPVSRADLLDAVAGVLGSEEGADAGPAEIVTRHRIAESRRALHILLAEDNPVNQEVAATMLRKRGHRVDVVANGAEAVDRAGRVRYDVVLMDIQMPEMDGLEATRSIRTVPDCHDLPIVALTAHALPDERERCLACGMNAYLAKPFKAWELFAAAEGWGSRSTAPAKAIAPVDLGTMGPPPVDLDGFKKEMEEAGAGDAVAGIVDAFQENASRRIDAITRAVAASETAEVARLGHAFKSSAAQLGAHGLAAALLELEVAGKEGAMDHVRERFERFREEAETVLRYLRSTAR
jgi:two-component system sensor histidine kinase/response regulator